MATSPTPGELDAPADDESHALMPPRASDMGNNHTRRSRPRSLLDHFPFDARRLIAVGEVIFRFFFRWAITPIFIITAASLMAGSAYYWLKLVLPAVTGSNVPWGTMYGLASTCLGLWVLFNVVWNYVRCMLTSSAVPQLGTEEPNVDLEASACDSDHAEYCKRCRIITPPRAMHCVLCDRCILGMDHHCPWLAGCIGHHNHPYFFLFLFYVVFGCAFLSLHTLPLWWSAILRRRHVAGLSMPRDRTALTLVSILPSTLSVAVGLMMTWHAIIICCGCTSLEIPSVMRFLSHHMKQCCFAQDPRLQTAGMPVRLHRYDQGGIKANWKEFFGVRQHRFWYLTWCLPIAHLRATDGMWRDTTREGSQSVLMREYRQQPSTPHSRAGRYQVV